MFVYVVYLLFLFSSTTNADVCDKIYQAAYLGKVEGNDTPSPIEVNICFNQIQDINVECKFNTSICEDSCRITGYESDQIGCPISCKCKIDGFLDEDIKFELNDLTMIEKNYGIVPSDVEHAASVGLLRWDQIKEDGRIKVPYVIDSSMSFKGRSAIELAMSDYSNLTCIDFVENAGVNSSDYIAFVAKGGCWSYVGRRGGRQEISIGYGCEWKGVVQHEIMHALGFWHEQSRPDRDDHVTIHYGNVLDGKSHNFNKRTSIQSFGSPYDLTSIMHYDGYAFSKNQQPTITVKATDRPIVSQRSDLSTEDVSQINQMYHCEVPITTAAPIIAPSWSLWSAWSSCSVTCSGGIQTRQRECQTSNGAAASGCYGVTNSTQKCETQACETTMQQTTTESTTVGGIQQTTTVAGIWSKWGNWGSCSKSCGSGYQWRYRNCIGSDICSSGSSWSGRRCNTHPCVEGSLFTGKTITSDSMSCTYGIYLYGDFNGDGRTDIICYNSSDWIQIFSADQNGTSFKFTGSGYTALCKDFSEPTKIITGDFNGDKSGDLLCQGKDGQIRVNFSTNSSFYNKVDWSSKYSDFCTEEGDKLETHDVNGDGFYDLVCSTLKGVTAVMLNTLE